ncbi:MAG: hypothetical protein ABR962_09990 [Candidatus Bathyarchaeia archaeon]
MTEEMNHHPRVNVETNPYQTVFHMNPKPNGDFTEPLIAFSSEHIHMNHIGHILGCGLSVFSVCI